MSTLTKSVFLNAPKVLLATVYHLVLFRCHSSIWLVVVVISIVVSDVADGKIIIRNALSRRLLDSLLDKLIINSISLATVLYYKLPLWFYIPLFFRDTVILLGGIYLKRKQIVIFPNLLHKAGMLSIAITGMGIIMGLRSMWLIIAMYCLCYASLLDYIGLFLVFANSDGGSYYPTIFQGFKNIKEVCGLWLRSQCGYLQ